MNKTRVFFGRAVSAPEDHPIAVVLKLALKIEKNSNDRERERTYYLQVKILMPDGFELEKAVLLAQWHLEVRTLLFKRLENEGISEEMEKELSEFILDQYLAGEVKAEDVINKVASLYSVSLENIRGVNAFGTRASGVE